MRGGLLHWKEGGGTFFTQGEKRKDKRPDLLSSGEEGYEGKVMRGGGEKKKKINFPFFFGRNNPKRGGEKTLTSCSRSDGEEEKQKTC